jgi:hypothetical protein
MPGLDRHNAFVSPTDTRISIWCCVVTRNHRLTDGTLVGLIHMTDLGCVHSAIDEDALRSVDVDQSRCLATNATQPSRTNPRDRTDETRRVWVSRAVVYLDHWTLLDDDPPVDYGDTVCQASNSSKVVRDDDHRHRSLRLHILDQFHDRCRYRWVETGERFVGNQECWCLRDGCSEHRALGHPPRQFVPECTKQPARPWQFDLSESGEHPRFDLLGREVGVRCK